MDRERANNVHCLFFRIEESRAYLDHVTINEYKVLDRQATTTRTTSFNAPYSVSLLDSLSKSGWCLRNINATSNSNPSFIQLPRDLFTYRSLRILPCTPCFPPSYAQCFQTILHLALPLSSLLYSFFLQPYSLRKYPKAPLHIHRNVKCIIAHIWVINPKCLPPWSSSKGHDAAVEKVGIAFEVVVGVVHAQDVADFAGKSAEPVADGHFGFLEADRGTNGERVGEVRTGCLIVLLRK